MQGNTAQRASGDFARHLLANSDAEAFLSRFHISHANGTKNHLYNSITNFWKNCKGQFVQNHAAAQKAGQYRTKIVRQMRCQIFRQMKQKAE